jgi:hypothetical protein
VKFFKITNLDTFESWCVKSSLPDESKTHVAASQHLDLTHRYQIEEISIQEFYGLPKPRPDPDTDDEWDD